MITNKDAEKEIIHLFHHIHHLEKDHKVHHCGGAHSEIDPKVNYNIEHCDCGKHRIDKEKAIGHAMNEKLQSVEVKILFTEKCVEGGWHVESGILENDNEHPANIQ